MIYESLEAVELVSLLFSLAAFIILVWFCRQNKRMHFNILLVGYFFMVLGLLFTNIESIIFPKLFNLLEHICRVALPPMLFAKAAYDISRID